MHLVNSTDKTILFVCTGNAGRSQIAQALFGPLSDAKVLSAGVEPWPDLHPVARRLLQERGIDTGGLHPKHVKVFADTPIDWVVTIGDRARSETPSVGANPTRIHWDISDPADADGTGCEEAVFRATLKDIEERLPCLLSHVNDNPCAAELHFEPGISTCVVRPNRFQPSKHLPAIAAAGFKCIELNCFCGSDDFPWDVPSQVDELRQSLVDTGVRLYSVHAAGGLGGTRMGHSEGLSVDLCKAYADLTADLGAPIATMHAGLPTDEGKDVTTRQLRRSLDELSRHILDMPCRYAWENIPQGWGLRLSPPEHLNWIRELDPGAFSFAFDCGHSQIDGTTEAYLQACQGLLSNLHINGNNRKHDEHRIPGPGNLGWKDFMRQLRTSGYVGPLMLEIEDRDRQDCLNAVLTEACASVDWLKSLLQPDSSPSPRLDSVGR